MGSNCNKPSKVQFIKSGVVHGRQIICTKQGTKFYLFEWLVNLMPAGKKCLYLAIKRVNRCSCSWETRNRLMVKSFEWR